MKLTVQKRSGTRQLSILALLIGLDVVLSRVASIRIPLGGAEGLRIGFGALPIVFAGMVYGPLAGAIVGGVGDLLGYFVNPMGGYLPVFTVTAALRGLIPGLVWNALGRALTVRDTAIPIALSGFCSAITVPLLLRHLFGLPLAATLPGALLNQCVSVPVYTLIFLKLCRALARRNFL